MLHLVYSPHYLDYSFGPHHPFWPERAQLFLAKLSRSSLSYQLHRPKKASDADILLVHHPDYLAHLKTLARQHGFLSPDTPVTPRLLEAAYYSVGGSILAARLALQHREAINLLGGLHHAGIRTSSGFCLFNDHAIAIRQLQKQGKIKKALVFDLDVHAGQGTQEIFYHDPTVFTVSLHQDPTTLYPGTGFPHQIGAGRGRGYNRNIVLPPGTTEKAYLQALDSVLPLYRTFQPDLVCLVLGVDTYKKDPLAQFQLEKSTYFKIGQRFASFPHLAVFFAGGYSKDTPDLWFEFLKGLAQAQ